MLQRFWLCCAFILASSAAYAAGEALPLFYNRSSITVVRQSMDPLPWQPATEKAGVDIIFDTEIRDGATLYNQSGWINLTTPSPTNAVMMVFGAPVLAPIIPSSQYAAIDVLMLNQQGTIMQVFPSLQLSQLSEEIYPEAPISAFLFLGSGICKKFSIAPGDYVEYPLFKRPPKAINAPPAAPPAERGDNSRATTKPTDSK